MNEDIKLHRREAAKAARAYLAQNLSWEQFMNAFGDSKDELIEK